MRWGLVSTIKAPADEILRFAAYHLDLGAHRLYLYLDADNPDAFAPLKAHPKIRVRTCDDAYWTAQSVKRPRKHQVRQSHNATHAYHRRAEVDWLIHMDVDEFLCPATDVATPLAALPAETLSARIRPDEALSGDDTAFKGFIHDKALRAEIVARLYPTYGAYLKGGFLSHVAGKLFVRTGLDGVELRIHNMFRNGMTNPQTTELRDIALAHRHAISWEDWITRYRNRLRRGSYRPELAAARPGGVTLNALFHEIEARTGERGLRAFHEEVCAASPRLLAALAREGLLRRRDLALDRKLATQFPAFSQIDDVG